jgi:ketosteroid isomerase-like protein
MERALLGEIFMTIIATAGGLSAAPPSDSTDSAATVAALDVEFQAAVKRNDAATVDRILHPQFVMVRGDGGVVSREEVIAEARSGLYVYEQQDEPPGTQAVRVWGDTAVVTAQLWIKGTRAGKPFDKRLWFSDTYVRTDDGWKYAFAQVSLPLPEK